MSAIFHPSFYKATADGYHKRFIDALQRLPEINAPDAKELYIHELKNIYAESKAFLKDNSDYLDVQSLSLLQHIVAKDINSHLAMLNADKDNTITT